MTMNCARQCEARGAKRRVVELSIERVVVMVIDVKSARRYVVTLLLRRMLLIFRLMLPPCLLMS